MLEALGLKRLVLYRDSRAAPASRVNVRQDGLYVLNGESNVRQEGKGACFFPSFPSPHRTKNSHFKQP
jgi:hypothetical protein